VKKKTKKRTIVEVNVGKLDELVDKARKEPLDEAEAEHIKTCIHAMAEKLQPPQRSTEKARNLLGGEDGPAKDAQPKEKGPRPGHGRNGAAAHTGATTVPVPHETLFPKAICPECHKGKVYEKDPSPLVRIVAMPPIQATVYQLQQLRCNLCDAWFVAEPPEGVGEDKYDESVPAMIGILKYGTGMPFNRIEKLQKQMGVPLPAGTQFDLVNDAAIRLWPIYDEFIRRAAGSEVLTYDDTFARILDKVERPKGQDPKRTGLKTTGVVAEIGQHKIGLFLTGPRHAGENVGDILKKRAADLPPLKTMADGIACNNLKVPPGVQLLPANCLTHGRRKFVDVFENFPDQCRHVIEQIGLVYHHDKQASDQKLSPEERLRFHQQKSGPILEALKKWMAAQIAEKKTEPNSGLGTAIAYFDKRWEKLTLFLRHAGAPLDSNIVERALKKAILHRNNALFFKTQNGADVGDFYMSAIHTCELNQVNAFDYLHQLLQNVAAVRANPGDWMPWNFRDQLSKPDTG
jgi:hypothetical protein